MQESPLQLVLLSETFPVAVRLADVFGFSPVGPKWEAAPVVDSADLNSKQTWWAMAQFVEFDQGEARAFSEALSLAIDWLIGEPCDFPVPDTGLERRKLSWDEYLEMPKPPDFVGRLSRLRDFAFLGGFKVQPENPPLDTLMKLVRIPAEKE